MSKRGCQRALLMVVYRKADIGTVRVGRLAALLARRGFALPADGHGALLAVRHAAPAQASSCSRGWLPQSRSTRYSGRWYCRRLRTQVDRGRRDLAGSERGGVRIDGPAQDNVVIGNKVIGATFYGAEVRSAPSSGLFAVNNRIGGESPAEGNLISGNGSYSEEGFPQGGGINLVSAQDTTIQNNLIGTTADGSAAYPNQLGPAGIVAGNSTGTIVRNNLISGFAVTGINHAAGQRFGVGISLTGDSTGSLAQGNRIGTDSTGLSPIPNHSGLAVSIGIGTSTNGHAIIGGLDVSRGNTVFFNETDGVRIDSAVQITGNSIDQNGAAGIVLGPGANGSQAAPSIQTATVEPTHTRVTGTLHSAPNQQFALEFFASPACDPSGFGEGRTFLGVVHVGTDNAGDATFAANLPGLAPPGSTITATATQSSTGSTSAFSSCVTALGPACYANCDQSTAPPILNVNDFICFQSRFAGGNPYANCDGSTTPPVLNVNDFICFQAQFAAGCL